MVDLSASYQEVSQFEQSAQQWWDSEGEFSGLHKMNPIRLSFIKDRLCEHFDRHRDERKPFRGLNIIDVGCGGGLVLAGVLAPHAFAPLRGGPRVVFFFVSFSCRLLSFGFFILQTS